MVKIDYRTLKGEAKSCRIFINPKKYGPYTSTNVPVDHQEKFEVIQELGRTLYSTYGYVPHTETQNKPWQKKNKQRAAQLVHFAAKCRRENRNEPGWRNEVEFRLFERFDIEVACKRCRKRLWRSEIEANPSSSNSSTLSLNHRQQKREPCKCNPTSRLDDCLDPGMSDLFSSRIEETACQTGKTDSELFNPKKQPDRLHGLQRTQNFDKLLQTPYAHNDHQLRPPKVIEDVVKVSVNPDKGVDPLLFPFLVLEAKGEKSVEGFEHMEIQTAFPIKNALQLQYDLLKTRGNTMDVPGGPLVWFLANKGEDWRVYAAVVYEEEGRPNYWINHLWGGSITGLDEALQLILIVDYILDWARDIYRPNILRQLRMLSTVNLNDAMTFAFDPDVFSLCGEVEPWMEGHDIEPEDIIDPASSDTASITFDDDPVDPLTRFKTPQGLIRDARIVDSRLRGLYITRDNVQTFLQGFESPNEAMRFTRKLLTTLSLRCVVLENEDVLNAVEDKWTGNARPRSTLPEQQSKIYAQFRVSYFISPAWEQVRELTYLAVSDGAREILIECAQIRDAAKHSRFNPPSCSQGELIHTIDSFLQRSVQKDFVAALTRRTFTANMDRVPVVKLDSNGYTSELISLRITIKRDQDKKVLGLWHRSLCMASTKNTVLENASLPSHFSGKEGPFGEDKLQGQNSHFDKVLVYGDVLKAPNLPQGSEKKLCLYILDGQTKKLDPAYITAAISEILLNDMIYDTIRK